VLEATHAEPSISRDALRELAGAHQQGIAGLGKTGRHPDRAHPTRKPQQHAYIERYNRTVRYGWLARTLFDTIEQVRDKATRWLCICNQKRPNTALGGITPMQKLALAA